MYSKIYSSRIEKISKLMEKKKRRVPRTSTPKKKIQNNVTSVFSVDDFFYQSWKNGLLADETIQQDQKQEEQQNAQTELLVQQEVEQEQLLLQQQEEQEQLLLLQQQEEQERLLLKQHEEQEQLLLKQHEEQLQQLLMYQQEQLQQLLLQQQEQQQQLLLYQQEQLQLLLQQQEQQQQPMPLSTDTNPQNAPQIVMVNTAIVPPVFSPCFQQVGVMPDGTVAVLPIYCVHNGYVI